MTQAPPLPSTWSLLISRRDFTKLIAARLISMLGDNVHTVATMWLAKEMTGSATAMATIFIANTIPRILFALVGGVSVDRYSRRAILVFSDTSRALGVLILVLLAGTGRLEVWHIAAFAAYSGAVASFYFPAVSASIPHLVLADELQKANALSAMSVRLSGIAGAALGGIIISAAGLWRGYLVDSLSFAISALLIISTRLPRVNEVRTQPLRRGPRGVWQDLQEGLAYLGTDRLVLGLVLVSARLNLIALPGAQLIPALAAERHFDDPARVGWLWSGVTLGMFLGALLLNTLRQIENKTIGVLLSSLAASAAAMIAGLTPEYLVALAGLVLMGLSQSVAMLLTTTLFQSLVPKEIQGRFFGNVGLLTLGVQPLILWGAGIAADQCGAGITFAALGAVVAIFLVAWGLRLPHPTRAPTQ